MPEMSVEKLRAMRVLADQHAQSKGWTIDQPLGSGGSAAVFSAKTPVGTLAVKVYDPTFFEGENGPAERHRLELQQKLVGHQCSSLVSIDSIEFNLDTCFVSMEFLPWLELSKCLDAVPRTNIWSLITQLVVAVRYLEKEGLVHRDIKPHNVMVSPDFSFLKLIDLGVVRNIADADDRLDGTDHGHRRPFVATAQYSSPEYLFRLREPSPELWQGLSIYQIGAVIHDLITKRSLFDDEVATANRYAVAMAVLSKIPSIPSEAAVPLELRRFATYCLTKDLDLRLQLVRWEDFDPPTDDIEAQLARRLEQRVGGQRGQVALIEEQRRREMQRKKAVDAMLTGLDSELKTGSMAHMHPECIPFKADHDRGMFRLHIPNSDAVVDASIGFKWIEQGGPSVAAVSLACTLKHKDNGTVWVAPNRVVGRLGSSQGEIDLLIASLRQHLIRVSLQAFDATDSGLEIGAQTVVSLSVE